MKAKLSVLISSIDDRIGGILNVLQTPRKDVRYIVVHQVTTLLLEHSKMIIKEVLKRDDVQYIKEISQGVAKNRNRALQEVNNGIALLADDDIVFYKDTFDNIIKAFEENSKCSVITFKTMRFDGQDYKHYSKNKQKLNDLNITGVGAIEVAFKVKDIKSNNIWFDNDFGPGSPVYQTGEDFIFMSDIIGKNLQGLFLPIPIVKHPNESTGTRLDKHIIFSKGAVFARVFGLTSFLINVVFAVKKYPMYQSNWAFFAYLALLFKGSCHYVKEKNMANSLISIITPNYNSQAFIRQAVESVLAQTYKNFELIIIDDVSTDNSIDIVKEYPKKDERIKLISLKQNKGVAFARNQGIKEAKGRYIAFLDSDDLWKAEKLEKQLTFMQENDLAFTCTGYEVIGEDGKGIGSFMPRKHADYYQLLTTNSIGCLTAMYDVSKLGKCYFKQGIKHEDYVLWLEILKRGIDVVGIKETLAYYRKRESSLSSNKLDVAKAQWKIYRHIEKLSFVKSCFYFSQYAWNGFRKY